MISEILPLGSFAVGETGCITSYTCRTSQYRQKLLAMGLTPGTAFTVKRKAPLGCPLEINFRGYTLSLRKEEVAILQAAKQ
jgi:ferrous iron transport protein A